MRRQAAFGLVLFYAHAAWAVPECGKAPNVVLTMANDPKAYAGCLMYQFGPTEQTRCQEFTTIIPPAANPAPETPCWICTTPDLAPLFKDPKQWHKFNPSDFDCLGICSECTCAQGFLDRVRFKCVKELCPVPGLADGNLQAGYFVKGGKLFHDVGDASCSPPDWINVWTPWFNRDGPGGKGDYEMLAPLVADGSVCSQQVDIQCRRKSDGKPWQDTGEQYSCDLKSGGVCVNGQQSAVVPDSSSADANTQRQRSGVSTQLCSDYEVRYCCDIGVP